MPLSEYKFDHSRLVVLKRTPKLKIALIGGVEKALVKGYEESTLWDISGPDVACVGVETSTIIVGMALVGQLSSEAMVKEIVRLKQLVTQMQNELIENVKHASEDNEKSLEELKIALEAKHVEEKQQLLESHSLELEELQVKIESTLQEKQETKALQVIKD